MELLFIIELALLILFIALGVKLIGKILGFIVALTAWILVGGLLFGIFLYPDYKNFKDPTIKLHIDKINDKTIELILKYKGINVDLPDTEGLNLDEAQKNELVKKLLNEELKKLVGTDITIREGKSPGIIYVDLSFVADNPKLLDNKTSTFEKIKIILKGYKEGHVRTEPELKNKKLILMLANWLS